jgi:hypothetical protein
MFDFISDNTNLTQKFKQIDTFYDGWFTERKITLDDVKDYFPNISKWDKETFFTGMLWLYYNYPIDFLYKQNIKIPGVKMFRKGNLARVACFLKESNLSSESQLNIMKKITETTVGKNSPYQVFGNEELRQSEIVYYLKGNYVSNIEEQIVLKNLNHPFGKKDKSALNQLLKRIKPTVIFTQKAIANDKELSQILLVALSKWELFRGDRVEKRRELKEVNLENLKNKSLKERKRDELIAERGHLLDQAPSEILGIRKNEPEEVVVVKKLFHKITKKPFIPYREELGFDIDPNIISDKIKEISDSGEFFDLSGSSSRGYSFGDPPNNPDWSPLKSGESR